MRDGLAPDVRPSGRDRHRRRRLRRARAGLIAAPTGALGGAEVTLPGVEFEVRCAESRGRRGSGILRTVVANLRSCWIRFLHPSDSDRPVGLKTFWRT
jgi:hypothetical protein